MGKVWSINMWNAVKFQCSQNKKNLKFGPIGPCFVIDIIIPMHHDRALLSDSVGEPLNPTAAGGLVPWSRFRFSQWCTQSSAGIWEAAELGERIIPISEKTKPGHERPLSRSPLHLFLSAGTSQKPNQRPFSQQIAARLVSATKEKPLHPLLVLSVLFLVELFNHGLTRP